MSNLVRLTPSQISQINQGVDHYNTLVYFVRHSLRESLDYGTIPGCGDKPILFKPGAEKIATLFGYREQLERLEAVKDWTGQTFGEPFFQFEYKVTLRSRDGEIVAESIGSCNSWEDKYRYRKAERTCPHCNATAIIKGKVQYGGGWLCYKQKGGCGAKFPDGDASIEGQEVGKVRNERIYDQVNTIDKMAQKRAYVGAVILAANASNFFSVDHESVPTIDADWEPTEGIGDAQEIKRVEVEVIDEPTDVSSINRDRIREIVSVTGHSVEQVRKISGFASANELTQAQCTELIEKLLLDYAAQRNLGKKTAESLIAEIRRQQPNITDTHLRDRFLVRMDEIKHEMVAVKRSGETYQGVSIE